MKRFYVVGNGHARNGGATYGFSHLIVIQAKSERQAREAYFQKCGGSIHSIDQVSNDFTPWIAAYSPMKDLVA